MCNMKALSVLVEKLEPRLSLLWTDGRTDGRTDGQTDGVIPIYPPQTSFAGGITIAALQIYANNSVHLLGQSCITSTKTFLLCQYRLQYRLV